MEEIVESLRKLTASCNKDDIERASRVICKLGKSRPEEIGSITRTWCVEFVSGIGKELAFLYVVNDVVQKTRKDGNFGFEFGRVLGEAFGKARERNRHILPKMERIVNIWKTRHIYRSSQVRKFLAAIKGQRLRTSESQAQRMDNANDYDEMSSPTSTPMTSTAVKPSSSRKRKASQRTTAARARSRKFPPLVENDLRSICEHLSYAKTKSRDGREKLSKIAEEIIREGNLPPEFVEKLNVLSKEEFEGFADQVKATLEALEIICSGLSYSEKVQGSLKRVIDAETKRQNEMIADIETSLVRSKELVRSVKMMLKGSEAKDGLISFDHVVAAESNDYNRDNSGSDKLSSSTSKSSAEVLNLLKALEPDEDKLKEEEEALRKEAEAKRAEEARERERERKRNEKRTASKQEVWDPRLRAYVTVTGHDTGDDWRS